MGYMYIRPFKRQDTSKAPAFKYIIAAAGAFFKKGKAQTMNTKYSNLEVIIDAEADAERGIADLKARGILQECCSEK